MSLSASLPAIALGVTVCAYWTCVGLMVLRVRRNARGVSRVLVPAQRLEQFLWLAWVPLIAVWIALPFLFALSDRARAWTLLRPTLDLTSPVVAVLRFAAVAMAGLCLALSIRCWLHMGRDWRMGVDPAQKGRLFIDGPFRRVRHPIYALSVLLMLCSFAIVPTPLFAIMFALHAAMMNVKAANEEHFLRAKYGAAYDEYCRGVGRFVPRWTAWRGPRAAGQPLNLFQRAMLLWEETHPYIAAHAVELAGPADPEALRSAIVETCRAAGIGRLAIDRNAATYSYDDVVSVDVDAVSCADRDAALARSMTAELNRAFPDGSHAPLRWFVIDAPVAGRHIVALAYHHVAADAHAVARLLGHVLHRYLRLADSNSVRPLTTAVPADLARSFNRISAAQCVVGFLRAMLLYFRFRFVHKMPDERELGNDTATLLRAMPASVLAGLSAACRRRGVGLNDAFLAALAHGIAALTPDRHTSRHRRRLALATAMSGRRASAGALANIFGVFLSDAILMLRKPDAPLEGLLDEVATRTRALKARRAPAAAVSAMQGFFIRNVWPIFDIPNHRRSYRKLLPICGGVSTFAGDADVFGVATPRIQRYIRACPTGPAAPVVLAPTICNGQLELGLTFRLSCFPQDRAEYLLDEIARALQHLASAAPATMHA